MNTARYFSVLNLALLTLIGLAGCQDTGPQNTEYFTQDEVHSINTTLDHQIASGARHDAMLRELHFDSARLNALGRTKLDHMLSQPGPVAIYIPTDSTLVDARRQSILAYAKDHGRAPSDLTITPGLNPASLHRTAPDLQRITKTELGGKGDDSAADPSSSATDLGLPSSTPAAKPAS
ncbi:MAG TPA: hypothetical protein VFE58_18010 [Tepidisphaeraceae bacterium]|jgi:hypothetical protein|nr:hypothetical protein [Tepidisphaeraceae bacterium]